MYKDWRKTGELSHFPWGCSRLSWVDTQSIILLHFLSSKESGCPQKALGHPDHSTGRRCWCRANRHCHVSDSHRLERGHQVVVLLWECAQPPCRFSRAMLVWGGLPTQCLSQACFFGKVIKQNGLPRCHPFSNCNSLYLTSIKQISFCERPIRKCKANYFGEPERSKHQVASCGSRVEMVHVWLAIY
jgi:hypothetical protein